MSFSESTPRSLKELMAFKTIELLLLFTRVLVLLFFAQQTIRHIKKNGV